MRVLTCVLSGLCLVGGAVTSFAMTGFSPMDEFPEPADFKPDVQLGRSTVSDVDRFERVPSDSTLDPLASTSEDINQVRSTSDNLVGAPVPEPNMPSRGPMRPRQVRRTVIETYMEPIPAEELAAAKKLQEAIKSLKDSSEPEAQKTATDTIQQQLSEQFDLDLKQREKELADVEAKVKSLREQLDKRKAAREDIIGLRLKTITNDAAGLGFPSGSSASEPSEDLLPPSNAPLYEPNLPPPRSASSPMLVPSEGEYSDRAFTNPRGTNPGTSPDTSRKPPLDSPTRSILPLIKH